MHSINRLEFLYSVCVYSGDQSYYLKVYRVQRKYYSTVGQLQELSLREDPDILIYKL